MALTAKQIADLNKSMVANQNVGMGDLISEAGDDVDSIEAIIPAAAGTVEASKLIQVGADKEIDALVVADGGFALGSGAGTAVTSTAAELNLLDGVVAGDISLLTRMVGDVTFVIGAESTNVINVGLQLLDGAGVDIATASGLFAYLSDSATGDDVAATAPDGGVAVGTDGLAIPVVAGKAFQLISEADGDIDLDITESGVATWYLVVVLPNGDLVISTAITFA